MTEGPGRAGPGEQVGDEVTDDEVTDDEDADEDTAQDTGQDAGQDAEEDTGEGTGEVTGEDDKDWAWRRRIRSNPHTHLVYKWVVGLIGVAVTITGLILVPAPGPGWVVVFVGIAILASEFERAQRLLTWGRARLDDWNGWVAPKPLWFKGLVGLVTFALVLAVFYGLLLVSGVPGLLPDVTEDWIRNLPGL